MKEGDKGEEKPRLPAQQPQPVHGGGDKGLPSPKGLELMINERALESSDAEDKGIVFDHARLENGLGDFYAAVLKEPIPEKMLRLIEQLAKQERA
jgi:hypothetical protein